MPSACTVFSHPCLLSIVPLLQKLLQKGTKAACCSGALKQVHIAGPWARTGAPHGPAPPCSHWDVLVQGQYSFIMLQKCSSRIERLIFE